jgi:hypothetical protein
MNNPSQHHHLRAGPLLALASAFLFGASTPIAKLLLGITDPLLLALPAPSEPPPGKRVPAMGAVVFGRDTL